MQKEQRIDYDGATIVIEKYASGYAYSVDSAFVSDMAGRFKTAEEAIEAAKKMVEESLVQIDPT
jgi:hypothetical protein